MSFGEASSQVTSLIYQKTQNLTTNKIWSKKALEMPILDHILFVVKF